MTGALAVFDTLAVDGTPAETGFLVDGIPAVAFFHGVSGFPCVC